MKVFYDKRTILHIKKTEKESDNDVPAGSNLRNALAICRRKDFSLFPFVNFDAKFRCVVLRCVLRRFTIFEDENCD